MNHGNRAAWQRAAEKYVREHDELLAEAAAGGSLTAGELAVLEPLLRTAPRVVHLLSGHGLDDVGLVRAGARQVVGVDFSSVTTGAAARRSAQLGLSCAYVIAEVPPVPLADGCAELVYTGKGALIWLADLGLWASEIARILVPGGHLFVHEAHPLVPLWTWDTDEPGSDETGATSRARTSTTPSRPTARWSGSGRWARSSPPSPTPGSGWCR